jgi:type IV secretion system protein VirD4
MHLHRHLAALLTAALALLAGGYLAAWISLLFLGLDTGAAGLGTWFSYLRHIDHPQLVPYAWRIRSAGAIGFGLPLLAWLAVLAMLYRLRSHADLHGRARFAGWLDLARSGLLGATGSGIVVGERGGRLLRLEGQQSVLLAAPTRSGKGVGIVVPNLLDYRESAVVLDIKQENFALTSGWRRSIGHEVYLFNPFAADRRSHRWNPLSYVADDPAMRVSDLQAIAAMLYPDGDERDRFWVGQARNAFLAFALYLFERREHGMRRGQASAPPTFGALLRLSAGDGSELRPALQRLAAETFLGPAARTAFSGLLSQADVTFASIMGAFREPLNVWLNPQLDAATAADDFRLDDVRRRRMTIYVGIQPDKLAESRLIVNLFFSQLINANTRTLPADDPGLRHQCLLLMDEFTAIGRVDILARAVGYMAGYNLRLLPIVQSMAQLDAVYGKEQARTIVTNHALQIVFAPREQQDANDYSEMLGYTTVRRRARTRAHGRGRSVSDNEVLERRALMLPQELKALGPRRQILIYEGLAHPVLCRKLMYYRSAYFRRRLLPAVEVPPLAHVPNGAPPHGSATSGDGVTRGPAAATLEQPPTATPSEAAPYAQAHRQPAS